MISYQDGISALSARYTLISCALVVTLIISYFRSSTYKLRHIPTVGYTFPLLSTFSALRFLSRGSDIIEQGRKLPGGIFKYPEPTQWVIVIKDPTFRSELYRAPESTLSLYRATEEIFQTRYTFGKNMAEDNYHVRVVRSRLTKNLADIHDGLFNEISVALSEYITTGSDGDWMPIPAHDTMLKSPDKFFTQGRSPAYTDLSIKFTTQLASAALLMSAMPLGLKRIVAYFVNPVREAITHASTHLESAIRLRREDVAKAENSYKDLLSWMMQEAVGDEQTNWNLTARMLAVNFGAVHTSAMTFTHALFFLAADPHHVALLRKEVDQVVELHGWSKESLEQMEVLDSFIKETQRLRPLGLTGSMRATLRDFLFSDGTLIPMGETLSVDILAAHHDENAYKDPQRFDPLRFVKMKAEDGTDSRRFEMTSLGTLNFGQGKHACPGRWFVAAQIKMMLAYIVKHYDLKLSRETRRPEDLCQWFGMTCMPNRTAEVCFRKRRS